jgi:hypothetical protein
MNDDSTKDQLTDTGIPEDRTEYLFKTRQVTLSRFSSSQARAIGSPDSFQVDALTIDLEEKSCVQTP